MAQQSQHLEDEVTYYYDLHPTKEDLMGETPVHANLVHYLREVLLWLFREQRCLVADNLNFHVTAEYMDYPLAPDIAVIKGVDIQEVQDIPSWRVGKTGPTPQVVFEFASKETWGEDLKKKPIKYGLMGIKEYFAYDPNVPPLRRKVSRRLWGWQLLKGSNEMQEMLPRADGSLWSQHLESYLVPDTRLLRLYDNQGQRRLTQAEAEAEARQAAEKQAELEAQRAEAEKQRAEEAIRKASVLAEKLRSLGIDPDQL
jgi:Uma2 family endonuclease